MYVGLISSFNTTEDFGWEKFFCGKLAKTWPEDLRKRYCQNSIRRKELLARHHTVAAASQTGALPPSGAGWTVNQWLSWAELAESEILDFSASTVNTQPGRVGRQVVGQQVWFCVGDGKHAIQYLKHRIKNYWFQWFLKSILFSK